MYKPETAMSFVAALEERYAGTEHEQTLMLALRDAKAEFERTEGALINARRRVADELASNRSTSSGRMDAELFIQAIDAHEAADKRLRSDALVAHKLLRGIDPRD